MVCVLAEPPFCEIGCGIEAIMLVFRPADRPVLVAALAVTTGAAIEISCRTSVLFDDRYASDAGAPPAMAVEARNIIFSGTTKLSGIIKGHHVAD